MVDVGVLHRLGDSTCERQPEVSRVRRLDRYQASLLYLTTRSLDVIQVGSRSTSVLHSHAKRINLLDESSYFAALGLDEGKRAFEPMARRFQDG